MVKVYVLRHEQRGHDQTYASRLNSRGRAGAEALADRLREVGVNKVYCSPFLRAVETVAPFCLASGVPVAIEWGLCELLASKQHAAVDNPAPDPSSELERLGCTRAPHTSIVPPVVCRHPEGNAALRSRVTVFLSALKETIEPGDVVLLCTHMHVCNIILQQEDADHPINFTYPQGAVTPVNI